MTKRKAIKASPEGLAWRRTRQGKNIVVFADGGVQIDGKYSSDSLVYSEYWQPLFKR